MLDKLDLFDTSKDLFISTYKALKRQLTKVNKLINEAQKTLKNDEDGFVIKNIEILNVVRTQIVVSLEKANTIINNYSANKKELSEYYDSLVEIYTVENI